MNAIFAMGTSTTTDDTGYFLWLAHTWPVFVPPVLAICAFLVFLVKRIIHSLGHGTNTPGQPGIEQGVHQQQLDQSQSPDPQPGPPPNWPLEFEIA